MAPPDGLLLLKRRPTEEEDNDDAQVEDEDEEEREIRHLEQELREMADQILHSRRTIPARIATDLTTGLIHQRPHIAPSAPPPPASPHEVQAESGLCLEASLAEADPALSEKLRIFRAKASSNIAAMPVVLKQLKDCVARIEKLDQPDVNVHSVFKRIRTY